MDNRPCKNCGSYGSSVGCDVCGPPIRKRNAEERLARTACSRSLELFESWEQFCRVKITGYTLRDGTDVCRFNFPTGKPNARTTDHMTLLINQGWQITAIHYEIEKSPSTGATGNDHE